jgi:2-C-methyl-D-erythritol 4-phosphate cytidylyltransferase/2-C-methyl-D-erythritol 2,4-cyclodiphosphate synthase
MTRRDLAVIVVAAGRGERLKASAPKAFVQVNGHTILEHSLAPISALESLTQVVIAAPETHLAEATEIANAVLNTDATLDVVVGGDTRQQSIANALAVVGEDVEIVLVHDAARAFASTDLFERVASAVRANSTSVIPALEIADTIKRVSGSQVQETVDRSSLRSAQTPQGFVAADLKRAYANASDDFTDDAALMQSQGKSVSFVAGEVEAAKITTPEDLAGVLSRLNGPGRTGIGVDVHKFSADASKNLFLGTIEWPGYPALEGHSDGDAVSHALVDALLSAAGLGDIGSNFGVDRPEFSGANGSVFLTETVRMVAEAGYEVVNASVQIVGNRPKVAGRRAEVESALSAIVGAPVTLGATTTDGLGFLGNDEGVAAVASVLIIKAKARLNS